MWKEPIQGGRRVWGGNEVGLNGTSSPGDGKKR